MYGHREVFDERPALLPSSHRGHLPYRKEPLLSSKITQHEYFDEKDADNRPLYMFWGYIKPEWYFDSNQVYGFLENDVIFYPVRPSYDIYCRNINKRGQAAMMIVSSFLHTEVAGPSLFSADTYGVAEFDLWAGSGLELGLLRGRNAYMLFEWEDRSFLIGQYWHPVYVIDCFADTIAFANGAPFEAFSRDPQIRFTYFAGNFSCLGSLASHVRTPYDGPVGFDSIYARNGILPNMHLQLRYGDENYIIGAGVNVNRLVPRLVTNKNVQTRESLVSMMGMLYAGYEDNKWAVRGKVFYAQNGTAYGLISGYAVHYIDPVTDVREYTNITCFSSWLDISYGETYEPALFLGYAKNLGSSKSIIPDPNLIYSYNTSNMDSLFRAAPRFRWYVDPCIFCFEVEYTSVLYGSIMTNGRVNPEERAYNVRLLLAAYYNF